MSLVLLVQHSGIKNCQTTYVIVAITMLYDKYTYVLVWLFY
jgi:hypothetical protein